MGFEMVGLGLCTHDYIAVVPRIPEFESSVRMRAVKRARRRAGRHGHGGRPSIGS